MHVSASGNYSSLAFIGNLTFIITLASNLKVYHRYYWFHVNVKLLFSFYSIRWHQDSCTKQDNLQMYSSNRCPAECSVFGETATHVGLEDTASNCILCRVHTRDACALHAACQQDACSLLQPAASCIPSYACCIRA